MRFFILAASFILFSELGWAQSEMSQVDLSSELLLRPSPRNPDEAGLESGRYKQKSAKGPASGDEMTIKLKKIKSLPGKKVSGSEVPLEKDLGATTSVVITPSTTTTSVTSTTTKTAAPKKEKESEISKLLFSQPPTNDKPAAGKTATATGPQAPAAPAPTQAPAPLAAPAPVVTPAPVAGATVPVNAESEEPSMTDQVRDMVMGTGSDSVEAYKEQIHPDDIRMNRIEVNVAPGVISNQSKSSYSFRNYSTFSPKVSLGANFWLTPFMGLYGDYTTSMGSDVASDSATGARVSAQHEWTELGFDVRKFFGMSRKSNSLQFGIHLSEYKFVIPGDDTHRVGLRSTGIGVHLMTRIPVAPSYAWVFGGKLIPRVQHTELGTGLDLSSGSGGESTRVDLTVGGEFKLARQNQIIWSITSSFEKNQFNGQANIVDPEKGSAPKGVSVENAFYLFSLGYRWGQ